MKATDVVENLKRRFPNEPEYIQAVSQVLATIEDTTSTQNLTGPTSSSAFVFRIASSCSA